MLGAVMFGHKGFQTVIDAIIKLAETAAKEPRELVQPGSFRSVRQGQGTSRPMKLPAAYKITSKTERKNAVDAAKAKVVEALITNAAEGEAVERQRPR